MSAHNDVGTLGEHLVAQHLAQISPVHPGRDGDLQFHGIEVEVKTARPSLYNGTHRGYQFLLNKPGHTNLSGVDVVVLLCLSDDCEPVATYILPVARIRRLRKLTKVTIPLSLNSPYSVFRDRWDVIAEAAK